MDPIGEGEAFTLPMLAAFAGTPEGQELEASAQAVLMEYGHTMYTGQTLEALCKLAVPALHATPEEDDETGAARVATFQRKTLNDNLQVLMALAPPNLSRDVLDRLDAARRRRNHLAHSWFWEAGPRMIQGECDELILDLQSQRTEFMALYWELVSSVFTGALHRLGVDPAVFSAALDAAATLSAQDPALLSGLSLPDDGLLWLERVRDEVATRDALGP